MDHESARKVTVRLKLGLPCGPERVKEYQVPAEECRTTLDALNYIWQHLDPEIAFRYECRSGKCGLCAVRADGKRCLACTTPLVDGQTVGPVEGLPLIRDLVADMALDSSKST